MWEQKRGTRLFGMLKNSAAKTRAHDLLSSDAEGELRAEVKCLVRVFNLFQKGASTSSPSCVYPLLHFIPHITHLPCTPIIVCKRGGG